MPYSVKYISERDSPSTINLVLFLIVLYQLALVKFLYPKTVLIKSEHLISGSYIEPYTLTFYSPKLIVPITFD